MSNKFKGIEELYYTYMMSYGNNCLADLNNDCASECQNYIDKIENIVSEKDKDYIIDIIGATNDIYSREFFKVGFRKATQLIFDCFVGGASI